MQFSKICTSKLGVRLIYGCGLYTVVYGSSQSDMQSKKIRCALIAARLHGGEHAAVGYTTVLEVSLLKELLFQKFCKRLRTLRVIRIYRQVSIVGCRSTFSFENKLSQKKITFSPLLYGGMFSCDNDRRETFAL